MATKGEVLINAKKKSPPKETLNLNSQEAPEIKNLSMDQEFEVTLKVKLKGINTVDEWDVREKGYKTDDVRARFEILDVVSIGATKPKKGLIIKGQK